MTPILSAIVLVALLLLGLLNSSAHARPLSDSSSAAATTTATAIKTATAAATSSSTATAVDTTRRIVGYFQPAPFNKDSQHLAELDGEKLTHLLFAFATPFATGEVSIESPVEAKWIDYATKLMDSGSTPTCNCKGECLSGYFGQLVEFKRKYPHVKTLLSIGGWTLSKNFSTVLGSANLRQEFVNSATTVMRKYFFDGIDIDWEFPGGARGDIPHDPKDWTNVATTLELFTSTWEAKFGADNAKQFILTTCLPAVLTNAHPLHPEDTKRISDAATFVLQMAYEYHHNVDRTRHHASLSSPKSDNSDEQVQTVSTGVRLYLEAGIDPSKLVVGIPAYAAGFKSFMNTTTDCFHAVRDQKVSGSAWILPPISQRILYAGLKAGNFQAPVEDSTRVAASICNGTHFYTFDTPNTVATKAKWIDQQNLGGIMLWDLAQDFAITDSLSLHGAIASAYTPSKPAMYRKNMCVSANETSYCNVQCDANVNEFELQANPPKVHTPTITTQNPSKSTTTNTPNTTKTPTSTTPKKAGATSIRTSIFIGVIITLAALIVV